MIDRRGFLTAAALVASPTVSLATEEPTTLLVGDSHAFVMERFFRAEARARGVAAEVVSHGGSSVKQWYQRRWLAGALARWPSVENVLVCLGTNCTRIERPRLGEDVRKLLGDAGSREVSWLLPPYHLDYLERAVSEAEVFAFSPGTLPLLSDGVHATPHGYELWARRIAEVEWE